MAMLQSAVRIPTPEPTVEGSELNTIQASLKRRKSRSRDSEDYGTRESRRRRQDYDVPRLSMEMLDDAGSARSEERTKNGKNAMIQARKNVRPEEMRSGGVYIPPARLRAMQQTQLGDNKDSGEAQRIAWERLKKALNGIVNKVNVGNIKEIIAEVFGYNLVRGRGVLCRCIMKAQAASIAFTPVYACMVAIVNSKLPQVGELLVNRLILQFRKAYKRNDKGVCTTSSTFLAHLINQQVVHETLAAQMLLLLLHRPTNDSVEIAVGLTREVGEYMEEMNAEMSRAVFEQFRKVLHEGDIDKRVQYMIEVLFQIRRDKYKNHPAVRDDLDLVEEEDQITHQIGLEDEIKSLDTLNIFKVDPNFTENEAAYDRLKREILGESGSENSSSEETSDDEDEEEEEDKRMKVQDESKADLVNLRRKIYLTIKSSGGFEECCHKLMKIKIPSGMEGELAWMIVECASQERTYDKFYGMIGERFCKLRGEWREMFQQGFGKYYSTIHRYETGRIRIIGQFFAYLLASDAIGWEVLGVIRLTEEDTTASSRIFLKILFEDLVNGMGMNKLIERVECPELRDTLEGIFPHNDPRDIRFSINYFTAIGMGRLTEGLRDHLKRLIAEQQARPASRSTSPSPLSSTSTSSSVSRSHSPSSEVSSSSYFSSSLSTSSSGYSSASESRSHSRSKASFRRRNRISQSAQHRRPSSRLESSSESSSAESRPRVRSGAKSRSRSCARDSYYSRHSRGRGGYERGRERERGRQSYRGNR